MSWNEVSLRDITIELASGGRPKGGAVASGVFSIGAEHLDGAGGFNLSNPKYIPEEYYFGIGKGKIELYDILIVKDGATTGKVSFVSESFPLVDAAINEHVFRLKLDFTRVDPRYCYFYLRSIGGQQALLSDFRGATIGGISKGILDKVQIPLPPLPIQKRIAEILDAADALRKKDQELLKKYDELAQAIFIDMFGDPVKNEKGWESQKLNSCLAPGESISYGIVQPGSEVVNGVPVIRVGDFESMSINKKYIKKIEKDIEAKHKRTRLIGDEILIACVGSIGKIALADETLKGYNIVRATARVRVDTSKLNRKYLAIFLSQKSTQDYFNSETRTVSQPTLNIKQIEETLVLIPSLKDQVSFEKKYDALQTMKNNLLNKMGENLFESLLQKAFSGELVS